MKLRRYLSRFADFKHIIICAFISSFFFQRLYIRRERERDLNLKSQFLLRSAVFAARKSVGQNGEQSRLETMRGARISCDTHLGPIRGSRDALRNS